MNHPILDKIWKLALYLSVWLLFIYFYFLYTSRSVSFELNICLLESVILGIFQFAVNIGLWYFLKYNRFEDQQSIKLLVTTISVGGLLIFFWIFSSFFLMNLLIGQNEFYISYFWSTIDSKILLGTIIYLFVLMFYYLIIYYQTFKENLIRQNQLAIKLQEQELSNLKAQINPHFLFNSLNSISYLIFNDPESAHHSIVQLSDYFRYSLSGTKQQFTSLEKELENIQRYLEIEKIRFDDKMRIHFEVAEQAQSVNVPILILQPLVENSIKHGVYESIEIIQIDIIIKYFEDFIQININNNFDKETKSKKGTGIGLENVRQRLELLYKRADLMKITKTENTFEVQLSIPKIQ